MGKILPLNIVIEKEREVYRSKDYNVEIVLDKLKCLGDFIEIEGNKEEVEKLVKLLELKEEARPYGELLEKARDEGKVKFDFNKFEAIC